VYRLVDASLAILFIAFLFVLVPESNTLQNTFGASVLILSSIAVGLAAGGLGFRRVFRRGGFHGYTKLDIRLFFGAILLVSSTTVTTGACWVNSHLSTGTFHRMPVTVQKKSLGAKSRQGAQNSFLLYVKSEKGDKRLLVTKEFWQSVDTGDQVVLVLEDGAFGFSIVRSFEANSSIGARADGGISAVHPANLTGINLPEICPAALG
jgi:hypothetical protein